MSPDAPPHILSHINFPVERILTTNISSYPGNDVILLFCIDIVPWKDPVINICPLGSKQIEGATKDVEAS